MAYDTSLMVANYGRYRDCDPQRRGHLVETAVGAYLLRRGRREDFDVCRWRDGNKEVDFVISDGQARTAIEVKGGRVKGLGGLDSFRKMYPDAMTLVVGSPDLPVEDFLLGKVPLFS